MGEDHVVMDHIGYYPTQVPVKDPAGSRSHERGSEELHRQVSNQAAVAEIGDTEQLEGES